MSPSPEMLAQAYDLLRLTEPFKRWKLPPSQSITFKLLHNYNGAWGDYSRMSDGSHMIRVNAARTATLAILIPTIAHEMCHLKQVLANKRDKSHHGRNFFKYAASVCRHHHFDPKAF